MTDPMMHSLARVLRRLKGSGAAAAPLLASVEATIRGFVDEPAAGEEVSRALPVSFRGWALEGLDPVAAVEIVLDGRQRVPARLRIPRPDVPAGLKEPDASLCAGWVGNVDLSVWPDSQVRAQVIARGRSGGEEILSERVLLVRSAPLLASVEATIRGFVDEPAAGEEVSRALPVSFRGWALEGLDPVAAVEIVLDGRQRVPARLRIPRPDVPAGLKEPDASLCAGWVGNVDLSVWPDSQVRAQVIARGRSGGEEILSERVLLVRSHLFAGSFDMPAEVTGSVLTVEGWAVVDRRGPSTVDIELDGTPVGRARLRLPVSDLETQSPYTPFAGFELSIVLESEEETTSHSLAAVVSGSKGSRFRMGERTIQVAARRTTEKEAHQAAILRARTQHAVESAPRPSPPPPREGSFRVLVFTHQLDLGGGQLYLQELLRQLAPILESCTVVSRSDGELRGELELLGIDVIVTGMALPVDMATYEGQVREHSMLILDSACQVALVNTLGDAAAVDAAARLGVPSVWAIHESFEVDHWLEICCGRGGPQPYVGERMKTSLGAATRLVFESQATSDMFARYADQERRLVVPYGVDIDGMTDYMTGFDRAAARKHHGLQPHGTVLLCVGMLEERKAQACLVEAFAEVAAEHPDATLVLVGDRPGPYSTALHHLIESLELGDRIRLLPSTKGIWEWYALSDVLVSASDVESLPRSMLEAMAFGLPVLSAAVFGVPELIRDAENGWLFEPRDMQALVVGLRRVLDLEPDARQTIGLRARTLVRERHRSTNYGRSYAELFRQVTVGPSVMFDEAPPSGASDAVAARTWEAVRPYTMTSSQRVVALCDAIRYICAHRIRGDIVECGVWRGGGMLAAARTLLECGDDKRTLWLYDTFSGMTPPDDVDRRLDDHARAADLLAGSTRGADIWAVADLEEVKHTMSLCAYPEDKIRYVVGPIERTLPETSPREIALLCLDTDWYASTRHELVHLFPRLSAGGVLIVNDYGYWEGQRKAVDEYLASIDTPVFLARIDQAARIAVVRG